MRRAFALLIVFVAVACGGSTGYGTGQASPSAAAAGGSATVAVAKNDKLGKILVDGSGRTLYLFEKDASASACYGSCATYWPPLLTSGAPVAGAGVDAGLLGTTRRTDGTTEVTYAGHPLYYVVTDHNPGDATGQAVDNFGAGWYVLGPDGNKIED